MSARAEAAVTLGRVLRSSAPLGWIARIAAGVRELGPYAAIELLLPGGSLLALLLWLYRRHMKGRRHILTAVPALVLAARRT